MTTTKRTPAILLTLAAGAVTTLAGQNGCVRRTMTIRTVPEGAIVRLNDQDVGLTPVTVDFTWYGDYDIEFEKPGYETVRTHHRINAPWYQLPVIDLFAEAFVPYTIHDHHEFEETLSPTSRPSREELTSRALEFRDRTLYGTD